MNFPVILVFLTKHTRSRTHLFWSCHHELCFNACPPYDEAEQLLHVMSTWRFLSYISKDVINSSLWLFSRL